MTNQKRIVMLTYGTRGDVEPFLALGVGLRNSGHSVCLVGPGQFAALAETQQVEFVPLEGNPDELAQSLTEQAGLNWIRMMVKGIQHVLPLARTAIGTIENAVRDADLIMHSFLMTDAGHTFARMQGVLDISVQFFPIFVSTSAFPAVALPDLPLGKSYRKATHALINGAFRYGSRLAYRLLRASIPGAPDLKPWPFQTKNGVGTPILFAYSSHILPRPDDWPSNAQLSGYWQLAPPTDWEPPEALVRFLESGEPPIYFGPGSVRTQKMQELLRIVIASTRAHRQRLMLNVSPEVFIEDMTGEDVFAMSGFPHAWLFPKMSFILHHGGAGTTGAAAKAGIPNTAIPFTSDQAFWARRIHQLGLGPAAPPANKLTRNQLDSILEEVLGNPAYEARAKIMGENLSKEDGVTKAIDIINNRLGT